MIKRAVLFDLDGVLVDSEGLYSEFWTEIDLLYPTEVDNFSQVIKGSTLPRIFSNYFPDPEIQGRIVRMLEEFEADMPVELFDGVAARVDSYRSHGYATAIVTSSNKPKMDRLYHRIPDLERIADILLTDADVMNSKPDPEGYMKAALRLACRSEDCVVFEDSFAGIEAGRRAGGKTIGVATTNPFDKIEPLVDLAVHHTADVSVDMLDGLFA